MKITDGIVDSAIKQLIPTQNTNARPMYSMEPEYITVHNTGNSGATAKQNADYVVNQNEYKSWHFTVGNNEVYQHVPVNETAWHCGDGENGNGNKKSIGIEIAEVYGADSTAVKFLSELIKATNISIDKIVPHKFWSGKNCPRLILPHWDKFIDDIRKEVGVMVNYKKYKDGTHELKGNALDLKVKIVDKSNRSITEKNCVNGTFFWYLDAAKTTTYPTSILIIDGFVYRNEANHLESSNSPQSVFIVYTDGKVDMKRVKYATELDYKNIKVAVGGVGLRNVFDSTFRFSPASEGFKGKFADVLGNRNKTVIGYNKNQNKVYLLTRKNITHSNLLKLISDNSTGEAYDIALSLDGGGSSFMNNGSSNVFSGDGRKVHNIIGFNI